MTEAIAAEPDPGSAARTTDTTARDLAEAATIFHLLADPIRLRVLAVLRESEGGELHFMAICAALGQGRSTSTMSHHVTLMRVNGLLERRREGNRTYYRAVPGRIADAMQAILGP